jgi:hypothetical protein
MKPNYRVETIYDGNKPFFIHIFNFSGLNKVFCMNSSFKKQSLTICKVGTWNIKYK